MSNATWLTYCDCHPNLYIAARNCLANVSARQFWSISEFYPDLVKEDRAFSLLHQEFPQILVLCFPWYLLSKKIGVTEKIWEKAGATLLRDLTEKSVNFSAVATSDIRRLLLFGEEDQ